MRIPEALAVYCWQWQRWKGPLTTVDGQPLAVYSPGTLNRDEGPDFLDADIQIGPVRWRGHIEVDLQERYWKQHGHDRNPHYRTVVLHAVWQPDGTAGHGLPVFDISAHVDSVLLGRWHQLQRAPRHPACQGLLDEHARPIMASVVEKAGIDRLQEKAQAILQRAAASHHDWETIAYILWARYLGSGPNIDAFEATSRQVPLAILLKTRHNLLRLEALLMGAGGLLAPAPDDVPYAARLRQEWAFLRHKYGLESLPGLRWKMHRLRPANFPTVRMAQLAGYIHRQGQFLRPLLEVRRPADVAALADIEVSDYWKRHYYWGRPRKGDAPRLGRQWQHNLMINVIAPLQYAYGRHQQRADLQRRALHLWDALPAEDNRITRPYRAAGFPLHSAIHSQGVLALYRRRCRPRHCLECGLGQALLERGFA